MTLYKLVQDVCNLGKAQPNVNFVTQGDIYQLNHNQDVDYPAFVVTQGTHSGSDYDEEQFTLTLFAVDRLVSDKSNEIDVQSWANSVLLSVIKNIGDFYIGTVQSGFKIQTFTEKFDSLCAGAYVTLAINVDINDCDCVSKSIGFVTSVNGQTGDVYLNIPYKVSDLRNDVPYASESFVNNNITDVSTYVSNNYLKKDEVPVLDDYYTKQEIDDKIRDVSVQIDLSNYYTKQEVYNKQEIETKIAQAGVSSVRSVNGQTGDVVLNYVDISVYNQHLEDFNQLYEDYFNVHIEEYNSLFGSVSDIQNSLRTKQDILISGTNIKTINGLSVLGEGNIVINGGQSTGGDLSNYYTKAEVDDKISDVSNYVYDNYYTIPEVDEFRGEIADTTDYLEHAKQDKLVSGTNIKTINGLSLLGAGDIQIKPDHQNILYADYQELSEAEKLKNIVYHITDYDIYFVNKSEYSQKITELEDRIKALEINLNK